MQHSLTYVCTLWARQNFIVCVEAVGDPVDQEAGVIIIMMSLSIATTFCSIIIKILLLLNHSVGSCTAQYNGKCVSVPSVFHACSSGHHTSKPGFHLVSKIWGGGAINEWAYFAC